MKRRVIYILIDGLRLDTALAQLHFMNKLVEDGEAALFELHSGLPSNSRPCYQTISTGAFSDVNGITSNSDCRLSSIPSVFHILRKHGYSTAASAYYWWSELYNKAPFVDETDTHQIQSTGAIQNGYFYRDGYAPDQPVFDHASSIIETSDPDYIVIHPSSVDGTGHKCGGESKEYNDAARKVDQWLENFIPDMLRRNPDTLIIVNSDHGMSADGDHGWDAPELRRVPFYAIGKSVKTGRHSRILSQIDIAPTICKVFNVPSSEYMTGQVIEEIC